MLRHGEFARLGRKRDIHVEVPTLTEYFLKKYSVRYNKPYAEVSRETMRVFMDYDWPGNVGELEQLIERAVIQETDATIRREVARSIATAGQPLAAQRPAVASSQGSVNGQQSPVLKGTGAGVTVAAPSTPAELAIAAADAGNYSLKDVAREAARQAERELISKMLVQTSWNRKETAQILGISYKALLYKIKENGLEKAS
jgi:two-component system, NtrC family, response regulator AtoC